MRRVAQAVDQAFRDGDDAGHFRCRPQKVRRIQDTIDETSKNFKDSLVARVLPHTLRVQSDVIMLSATQMKILLNCLVPSTIAGVPTIKCQRPTPAKVTKMSTVSKADWQTCKDRTVYVSCVCVLMTVVMVDAKKQYFLTHV